MPWSSSRRPFVAAAVAALCSGIALAQAAEPSDVGRWDIIADSTERLGGTNSGVLLPDGQIIYCHDTRDAVIFNPTTGAQAKATQSPRIQGCHAVTLMPDGRVIYVGGADREVYGPGTRQVKTFDPVRMTWKMENDLTDYRWYPTMVPLPDGELLAIGGGGIDNPVRVRSSEVMNPTTLTWTRVGDIALGNEVSPVVLLYTGEVLMTHRPPQLYNAATKLWRAAADFQQGNRMPNGDHADHELVLLADGRVVAIGFKSFTAGVVGNMVEVYDPVANAWRLGRNVAPVRSRASTVLLPDGKILVIGGYKEERADPTPVNPWGQVALVDLYDPLADSWTRMANINIAREYHAMPILVPDGRVIVVGGEGEPGNEPAKSTIEAFSPPYLFRGARPQIRNLSRTTLTRGETFNFDLESAGAGLRVVLIGTVATTHFMDSGNARHLELEFSRVGNQVRARIPADPARAVHGFYMLFAVVAGIPSPGQIVRIVAGTPPAAPDAAADAATPDQRPPDVFGPGGAGADGAAPDAPVSAGDASGSRPSSGRSGCNCGMGPSAAAPTTPAAFSLALGLLMGRRARSKRRVS